MNKQKEAENLQRMSYKMDYMQGMIKNTTNQTKTMESLRKITPLLNQQVLGIVIWGYLNAAGATLFKHGPVWEGYGRNPGLGQGHGGDDEQERGRRAGFGLRPNDGTTEIRNAKLSKGVVYKLAIERFERKSSCNVLGAGPVERQSAAASAEQLNQMILYHT